LDINDDNEECENKEDLNFFFLDAGLIDSVITHAMIMNLFVYIDEVTCPASREYSLGCALKFMMMMIDESQIQEAVQVSFDDTSSTPLLVVSGLYPLGRKLVVKYLKYKHKIKKENKKKIYKKPQEFSNGGGVVVLPCRHDVDVSLSGLRPIMFVHCAVSSCHVNINDQMLHGLQN
ncbi:hypothetical protein HID58_036317, partial [Brassica napus]